MEPTAVRPSQPSRCQVFANQRAVDFIVGGAVHCIQLGAIWPTARSTRLGVGVISLQSPPHQHASSLSEERRKLLVVSNSMCARAVALYH